MVWGALIGLAGSLIGGKKESKERGRVAGLNQQNVDGALGLYDQARQTNDDGFARAKPFLDLLLSTVQDGNRRAQGAISGAGQAALARVGDERQAEVAGGISRLARSGLSNSTLALQIEAGAGARASRRSSDILTRTGGQLAGVIQSGAAQEASAFGSLADFERQRAQSSASFLTGKGDILRGVQHTLQPGIAAGYGSLFGQVGGIVDQLFSKKKSGSGDGEDS